ncbi:hypothetical protein MAR_034940 [Mya arenaria]|uniref:Uncharacterized protein n=1 Tax=Mya arenaria TaxID=6604 RepID=A0ABY7ELH5_MYAAR|nr:hypothetical protein MAR_034940 [Mya arenaria]
METGDDSFDDDSLGIQAFHVDSEDDDLDLHLPPTTGNQYLKRKLAKHKAKRKKLIVAKLPTVENKADARLVPLNLFICLIARYFDQSDLKDDVR